MLLPDSQKPVARRLAIMMGTLIIGVVVILDLGHATNMDDRVRSRPTLLDRLRAAWNVCFNKAPPPRTAASVAPSAPLRLSVAKPYLKRQDTLKERESTFNWFGTLGFPDLKGKKLVRIATAPDVNAEGKPESTYTAGFLLEEQANTFSVMTLSSKTETFRKAH
jgi:hypothetical protein